MEGSRLTRENRAVYAQAEIREELDQNKLAASF